MACSPRTGRDARQRGGLAVIAGEDQQIVEANGAVGVKISIRPSGAGFGAVAASDDQQVVEADLAGADEVVGAGEGGRTRSRKRVQIGGTAIWIMIASDDGVVEFLSPVVTSNSRAHHCDVSTDRAVSDG